MVNLNLEVECLVVDSCNAKIKIFKESSHNLLIVNNIRIPTTNVSNIHSNNLFRHTVLPINLYIRDRLREPSRANQFR
jgi:hypothetical protein